MLSRVWSLLAAALISGGPALADSSLPRSTPEKQGVKSSGVLAFVEAADERVDAMHSFMLVRNGHVTAEGWWTPYNADSRHSLYSLSKSFTSTAVGIAIAEGKLSLHDEVLKFFRESAPAERGANLKSMRVSDLLRMSTGHQTEPPRKPDEPWSKTFLAHSVPFKPGTHFLYNTSATYMASAIVQKATGEKTLDYLNPRLFAPLGIENPTWETSSEGVTVGGFGLSVRTEDIAKFGQLYLQRGEWNGKQLVPQAWVTAATAIQTSNGSNPQSDWDQGYGFQFWRCRNGAYRGDGAFGQFCVVLPEQDVVIVITSGTRDMQGVPNLVYEHLLPTFASGPLPDDEAAQGRLTGKLAQLMLAPVRSSEAPVSVPERPYAFPPNDLNLERVRLAAEGSETPTLVATFAGQEHRVECSRDGWKAARLAFGPFPEQPAAASGGWTSPDTFTAKICFYETPFTFTVRLTFEGDQLRLESESNVGFGPTKQPTVIGKAERTESQRPGSSCACQRRLDGGSCGLAGK